MIPRTLYLLLGGFLLARLFYEVQTWPAAFASGSFFVLGSVVEILAMLLIGVHLPDTELLMQVGAARLIYVVFSNLIQIPLLILVSHFFNREESDLRIVWLLPLISIQLASISVCYVVQCHAADKDFPDYMVFFMAVLLFVNAEAGMADDAIQKMYDYDRQQFNSERTCIERTQEFTAPAYESSEEEASPLMLRYQEAITTTDTYHETKSSFAWIGEIEDEHLLAALEQLSDSDLELITLYAYEEYDTVEISKLFGTTKQNISKKIRRITNFIKDFQIRVV